MTDMTPDSQKQHFLADEDGSATPLAIAFVCIFCVIGGLAVDFNKAVSERTQMQLATDTAAHAALYTWEFEDQQASTTKALATITDMLPDIAYRDALLGSDIEYGFYDPDLGTFTVDPTFVEDKDSPLRSAVRATAQLEPERNNASRNIFLRIIDHDTFTIRTSSIYASYFPPCFNEGFVAQDVVDLQSGNSYTDGFCIHSNTYVSMNQNNFFEPGTVVSMPSLADLDIPSSGFEKNEGLQAALRSGSYRLRVLNNLPLRFQSLRDGEIKYTEEAGVTEVLPVLWPADVSSGGGGNGNNGQDNENGTGDTSTDTTNTGGVVKRMSSTDTGKKNMTPAHFDIPNRIYQLECSGNGDITFSADTFKDFALVTTCPIKFSNGTILENVIIATEGDVDASHVQIGKDDSCDAGGGAAIWTYGDVKTASALSGFGAQILALGDIQFTANADGIQGVSFIAGGRIDGTSNSNMGFCNNGGTENFQEDPYFRMVN